MATGMTPSICAVRERLAQYGVRVLSDVELLTLVLGAASGETAMRPVAEALADAGTLAEIAWSSADELVRHEGVTPARAAALCAAFELGRRCAWAPPSRGSRILDPSAVYELMRYVAHAEREEFHTVLLDVRGRLIKTVKIAEGSLTQCPVSPRDALREPVRIGAHGVVFVHNHPSGGTDVPIPSAEDCELTDRLRAAAELVGVLARDHVIVSAGGYFSFVEAGRWRR